MTTPTCWLWLHVGKSASAQSMHLPEFTREQAEQYGREALGDDWLMSAPRPKNEEPDTLEKQLEGAEFYRNKLKGETK